MNIFIHGTMITMNEIYGYFGEKLLKISWQSIRKCKYQVNFKQNKKKLFNEFIWTEKKLKWMVSWIFYYKNVKMKGTKE